MLTPVTPSLLSIRTSRENVIVHEENVIGEKDEAKVNENGKYDEQHEGKNMKNIIANKGYVIKDDDEAQVNGNDKSDKRPKERSTENIIANKKYVIINEDEAQVKRNTEFEKDTKVGNDSLEFLGNEPKGIQHC